MPICWAYSLSHLLEWRRICAHLSLYVYRSREGLPYLHAAAGDNARGHKMRRVESAVAASPICYHTRMELILFTGFHAAGQSTFYRPRSACTHTLVNLDLAIDNT